MYEQETEPLPFEGEGPLTETQDLQLQALTAGLKSDKDWVQGQKSGYWYVSAEDRRRLALNDCQRWAKQYGRNVVQPAEINTILWLRWVINSDHRDAKALRASIAAWQRKREAGS